MDINVIATGSTGNCVALQKNGRIFLLEAGIPWGKIGRGIKSRFSKIDGVFISHEHMDHALDAKRFSRSVKTICTEGTANACGLSGYYVDTDISGECGDWQYMTFDVRHDAAEPAGIYVQNGGDRVLFCTDTCRIPVNPEGLTHAVVECNYNGAALQHSLAEGLTEESRARRVVSSHMGLEGLLVWLGNLDMSCLQEVHLVHASGDNADKKLMKRRVQEATGVVVKIY